MVGTTEVATDRTAAPAMATTVTVARAVEEPYTMESRGPCLENPRISTVAREKTHGRPRKCHGHCRGPPPESQIMSICEERKTLVNVSKYILLEMSYRTSQFYSTLQSKGGRCTIANPATTRSSPCRDMFSSMVVKNVVSSYSTGVGETAAVSRDRRG